MPISRKVKILSREQIVAAIYETMIRPELCDRFSGCPAAGPAGSVGGVLAFDVPSLRVDPELPLHFARATEILDQLWVRSGRPAPVEFFENSDNYWILLNDAGHLARASRDAQETLSGTGISVAAELGLSEAAQDRVAQCLAQLTQQKNGVVLPEILATSDPSRKLMCRPVQCGYGLQAWHGVMIEALDFQWSSYAQTLLSATFGLNAQDVQLLAGLLEGNSLQYLGSPEQSGFFGLQAQLQSLVAKSGAPGIAEMLRLFCFLIAEVSSDAKIASGEVAPAEGRVEISDEQSLQFYKLGAETGQPVIFLHGLLDGIAGVQRLQSQFRTGGFRVYAPLRCGYGQSGPVPSPESSIDVFIDQLATLIDREKLQNPILLGHRGGAVFAHIAARRLRDRVAGAVIVSGIGPVRKLGELSALAGHYWWMAVAVTYGPVLLPLVVRSWARAIRQKGPMMLLRQNSRAANTNLNLSDDPQLAILLQDSHKRSLDQGGAGLMADFHWVVNDWRRHIGGHSAPVVYLHGDADRVTSVERLQIAMAGRSNVQVRFCQDGGPMLLYSRPELVLAALQELAERPAGAGKSG